MTNLLPLLAVLLMATAAPCFALQENMLVTWEQARAMGVTLRTNLNGERGIMVGLEFKPEGPLKNFSRVELEISAGQKSLMHAPILSTRPTPDTVSAQFSADPEWLPASVLTIVVQDGLRTRIGYEFKVIDFVGPDSGPKKSAAAAMPLYDTAKKLHAMPPTRATVEHIETFFALLRTADGKKFTIGSDRGEQAVWHFVGTALKKGQTYDFPDAFRDFEERKFYVTAEAIQAMPSGLATLEHSGPCFAIFRGADGKQFIIGDPGSGREVWQFLGTLKEGDTCDLPRAFLDYQKKKKL